MDDEGDKPIIDKTRLVGTGSYGAVYIAHWNGLKCAAKVIHGTLFMFEVPGRPNIAEQFEQECEVISQFRHPNIVQFLGMIRDPDTKFPVLLMELMDKSLTQLLESDEILLYGTQVSICHDVALAIRYLHSKGFVHRDISSNNVLMRGSMAKLTDLGVSVLIDSSASDRKTKCPGTEVYMPPDSVGEVPDYTEKIDCFSFGVLGVQIFTRCFPKPGPRYSKVSEPAASSRDGSSDTIVRVIPEIERRKEHIEMIGSDHPLRELFCHCLKDKEADRPNAAMICGYLRDLRDAEAAERSSRGSDLEESVRAKKVADSHTRQLKDSIEQLQARVAVLDTDNAKLRELVTHLESENALLQEAASQAVQTVQVQEPVARPSLLDRIRGRPSQQQQQQQQRQQREIQQLQSLLQVEKNRVEQLENEKAEKKQEHLSKWDWLEQQYNQKSHAARIAEQSLEKAEKNLKSKDELLALKNQRIANLEKSLSEYSEKVELVAGSKATLGVYSTACNEGNSSSEESQPTINSVGIQCTIATDCPSDAPPTSFSTDYESSDNDSPLVRRKGSQITKGLKQVSQSSLLTSSSEDMVKSTSADCLHSQSSTDSLSRQNSLKEHRESDKGVKFTLSGSTASSSSESINSSATACGNSLEEERSPVLDSTRTSDQPLMMLTTPSKRAAKTMSKPHPDDLSSLESSPDQELTREVSVLLPPPPPPVSSSSPPLPCEALTSQDQVNGSDISDSIPETVLSTLPPEIIKLLHDFQRRIKLLEGERAKDEARSKVNLVPKQDKVVCKLESCQEQTSHMLDLTMLLPCWSSSSEAQDSQESNKQEESEVRNDQRTATTSSQQLSSSSQVDSFTSEVPICELYSGMTDLGSALVTASHPVADVSMSAVSAVASATHLVVALTSSTAVATLATSTHVATLATSTPVATLATSTPVATPVTSTPVATPATSTPVATLATSTPVATPATSTAVATHATSTPVATPDTSTPAATLATNAASESHIIVSTVSSSVKSFSETTSAISAPVVVPNPAVIDSVSTQPATIVTPAAANTMLLGTTQPVTALNSGIHFFSPNIVKTSCVTQVAATSLVSAPSTMLPADARGSSVSALRMTTVHSDSAVCTAEYFQSAPSHLGTLSALTHHGTQLTPSQPIIPPIPSHSSQPGTQPAPPHPGTLPTPPHPGTQPAPSHTGVQPSPSHFGTQPAPSHTVIQPSPSHFGTQPASFHTGIQPSPSHFGTQPAPSHTGIQPAPSHTGTQPASSHTGIQPAPSHTGTQPASFHTGIQPAPSHTGTQPAPSHTGTQPAPSHTGTQPAPSHTGTQPAPSHTGTQPAPSHTGTQPAPSHTGTQPAPHPGTLLAPSHTGVQPALSHPETQPVPSHPGTLQPPSHSSILPAPSLPDTQPAPYHYGTPHPGAQPALSPPGTQPAPSHPGTQPALSPQPAPCHYGTPSHADMQPASSHPGTLPAPSHPSTQPAPSHPGTLPAPSHPGTQPAFSNPGTQPVLSHYGTLPAPSHHGIQPAPSHPGTQPASSHPGVQPAPSHRGTLPALSHPGAQLAPSHLGTLSAPSHPGVQLAPSHPGAQPAPSHPGTLPAPSHPGVQPAPSHPGAQPAPSHPGTLPVPSHPGAQPTPSHPGTLPAPSHPGAQPTPSHPGTLPAPSHPGAQPTPSHPSTLPAPSHPGVQPAPSHPGVQPAPSHPGTLPAPSHPGAQPAPSHPGTLPAPSHPGVQPAPSHPGTLPAPSHPGAQPAPSHPGPFPAPSHPGVQPAPSHPGTLPAPSHPGAQPAPSHPGTLPAPSHPGAQPTPSHPGTLPTPSHPGVQPAPSHPGVQPAPSHPGTLPAPSQPAPSHPGTLPAPSHPGAQPTPSHPGTLPAPSHPGAQPTPSHPGTLPAPSHPGAQPTPSHPGTLPAPSHPGAQPTPSHPGTLPAPSHPGAQPTPSHPGTLPAPSHPGVQPAPSHPGTLPASSHPGAQPAPSHPSTLPAPSHPGILPASSHPGVQPAPSQSDLVKMSKWAQQLTTVVPEAHSPASYASTPASSGSHQYTSFPPAQKDDMNQTGSASVHSPSDQSHAWTHNMAATKVPSTSHHHHAHTEHHSSSHSMSTPSEGCMPQGFQTEPVTFAGHGQSFLPPSTPVASHERPSLSVATAATGSLSQAELLPAKSAPHDAQQPMVASGSSLSNPAVASHSHVGTHDSHGNGHTVPSYHPGSTPTRGRHPSANPSHQPGNFAHRVDNEATLPHGTGAVAHSHSKAPRQHTQTYPGASLQHESYPSQGTTNYDQPDDVFYQTLGSGYSSLGHSHAQPHLGAAIPPGSLVVQPGFHPVAVVHPEAAYNTHYCVPGAQYSSLTGQDMAYYTSLPPSTDLRRIQTAPLLLPPPAPIPRQHSFTTVHPRVRPRHMWYPRSVQNPYSSLPPSIRPFTPNRTASMPEGHLPAHFAGVNASNVGPYGEEYDGLSSHYPSNQSFQHMLSTTTESSEEGSIKTTHSEPSLMSDVSLDQAKRSFHHSHSQGSELSSSSTRALRNFNTESARPGNAGHPINNSSRKEYHMRDTDSVKRFLESGKEGEQDEYIAVLIKQQYTNSRYHPWKVVFTVCKRNPCCIKPLLALLNEEYDEVFAATLFSVKFTDQEITLKIPEDLMQEQGYDVVSEISPCKILKTEASQPPGPISYAYPPRRILHITPSVREDAEWQPLNASLDLEGTDDIRKFTLKNPEVSPISPTTQMENQEQQGKPWPDLEPQLLENGLIRRIVDTVIRIGDQWNFGFTLGVPYEDLKPIIERRQGSTPSMTMCEIFSMWDKKVVDPTQRSWKQVIYALNAIGYKTLRNEIEGALAS